MNNNATVGSFKPRAGYQAGILTDLWYRYTSWIRKYGNDSLKLSTEYAKDLVFISQSGGCSICDEYGKYFCETNYLGALMLARFLRKYSDRGENILMGFYGEECDDIYYLININGIFLIRTVKGRVLNPVNINDFVNNLYGFSNNRREL